MTLKHLSSCVVHFDLRLSGTELYDWLTNWIWSMSFNLIDWYGITGMKVIVCGTGWSYGHSLDWFVKQSFSLSKSIKSPENWFYNARARWSKCFSHRTSPKGEFILFWMQELDEASAFHFYTSPQGKCNLFTRYKPEKASEFQLNAIPRGSKNLMVIQPSNEPGNKR